MTSLPRIAGITVGAIGIGTVAGRLALDATAGDSAPSGLLVAGIGTGAGALGITAGSLVARSAEQSLRPGLARAGRTSAAIGAALVAGSLLGEVSSRFLGIADGRRAARDVRAELERQQARIDAPQTKTKQASVDAERYERLHDEFQPLPTDAAERPRPGDDRIDLAGATLASAARALHQAYDANDDDVVTMDEQQRSIAGGSASIGTLMSRVHDAKAEKTPAGETFSATVADLEQVIADQVDTGGTAGVIDNDEAAAWFGPDGVGEKSLTWDGADAFVASVATPAAELDSVSFAPGPWREGGDDVLYLPGVSDVASAKRALDALSAEGHPSVLLVRLPSTAPTMYGVMSLYRDGKYAGKAYDDTLAQLTLDSAVIAAKSHRDVHDL